MKKKIDSKIIFLFLLCFAVCIFLFKFKSQASNQIGLPNPASKYCVEKGYKLEIRTNPDGSQYGVCIFPDGSECEEWAYYSGRCKPGEGHS